MYAVADRSVPSVQRRYLAAAVDRQFPGFAAVEYPDWRSFLSRLAAEAGRRGWPGPFVLDELPYLIAADPTLTGVLQAWVDGAPGRPCVVPSGSSQRMMRWPGRNQGGCASRAARGGRGTRRAEASRVAGT